MSHRQHGLFSGSRRGRPSGGSSSSAPRRNDQAAASAASAAAPSLPAYEPLSHPLTALAQRQLADIANSRDTRKYEQHLAGCSRYLRANVGAINDRLEERKLEAAAAQRRRDADGTLSASASSQPAGQGVQELEADVVGLTGRLEAAAREIIDLQAGLQDELASLAAVKTQVAQAPRPRQRPSAADAENAGAGADADLPDAADEVPIVETRELLNKERAARIQAYSDLTMYDKYCRNNDYISFKKTLQDATDPNVPVPDPAAWFDGHGQPVLPRRARTARHSDGASPQSEGGGEDDTDLVVTRQVESFRCPLTLATLQEPYSSNKCRHTFEKEAVLEFIRSNTGTVKCPVPGCNAELTAKDLYLDDVMLRKLKRAEKAAAAEDDIKDDVDAEEVVMGTQRNRPARGSADMFVE